MEWGLRLQTKTRHIEETHEEMIKDSVLNLYNVMIQYRHRVELWNYTLE